MTETAKRVSKNAHSFDISCSGVKTCFQNSKRVLIWRTRFGVSGGIKTSFWKLRTWFGMCDPGLYLTCGWDINPPKRVLRVASVRQNCKCIENVIGIPRARFDPKTWNVKYMRIFGKTGSGCGRPQNVFSFWEHVLTPKPWNAPKRSFYERLPKNRFRGQNVFPNNQNTFWP